MQEGVQETVTAVEGSREERPRPRATRKRLDALRDDLARRLAAAPRTTTPRPSPGRGIVALLRTHRTDDDAEALAKAKDLAAGASPGRGNDAVLEDLAWLGRAFVLLHDATGSDLHLDTAERLAGTVRSLEAARGGFRGSSRSPPDDLDAAGTGAAARFLVELSWRIGLRGGHRNAAERALRRICVPAILDAHPSAWPDLLDGIDGLLAQPLHATVTGAWENAAVTQLHRACLRLPHDPLVLDWSPAGEDFPDVGAPCVYLTKGSLCASPVTDEARLAAAVARLA
ncbi:MAG: hypothetical protein AABY18_00520 [Candidatus Thermoplasmatota archaeon]